MLSEYIGAAMSRAQYEILTDDSSYYGEIPELQGVWASAATLEECRRELQTALEDWILFRLTRSLKIPILDQIDLAIKELA